MSVAKHTGYNVAGALVPVVVALVSLPIYLKVIGLERYGILSICWLLLGYFGLFDLGLGRATAQRLAALKHATPAERSKVFWSAIILSTGFGIIAMLVAWPACYYALGAMKIDDPGLRGEIPAAVPWVAAAVPLSLIHGVLLGGLSGRERFGWYNVIDGTSNVIISFIPLLCAVLIGPQLKVLILSVLAGRLFSIVLLLPACWKAVPLLVPRLPSLPSLKSLVQYGAWVTVSNAISPLLAFWDRFAIGAVIGAAAVSVYVVPFTLIWRMAILPNAFSSALFPRLSASTQEEATQLYATSVAALSVVMTPVVLIALTFMEVFLTFWVGPDVGTMGTRVGCILLPGLWINSFAQVALSALHAERRPDMVAKAHLAEVVPYGLALYGGLILFGIEGAALAWSLRVAVDALLLFSLSRTGLAPLKRLFPAGIIVLLATAAALILPLAWPLRWVAMLAMSLGGVIISYRLRPPYLDEAFHRIRGEIGKRAFKPW